jgi:dipeptidyl aminopeptidase/acylaminoacyl peptidase
MMSCRFWGVLAAVILATFPLPSLSADTGVMGPAEIAKTQYVGSVAISPDGNYVAYTKSVPRIPLRDEDGAAWSELHVVDAKGNSRPFVTGHVNVGSIQWTPDGCGIAFLAKRSGDDHTTLHVLPVDGGESRPTLRHKTDISYVTFSGDGKQVAFLAKEPLAEEVVDYQTKGFRQEIYEEDWRATKVWIAAADGSGEARALDLPGSASSVRWRPNGKQLAVVLAPTSLVDDSYMFKRIRIVDVATGKIVERIENPGKLGQIEWSPDGKFLAMISGADIHDPRDGRLMVTSVPSDGVLKDLMPEYDAHVSAFQWKDAGTLMWVAGEGTGSAVGEVDLNGTNRILIGPNGPVLSGLSLADDGSAALVGSTPAHPREVFLLDEQAESARRLTHTNPWLDAIELSKQEVVHWTARDGLELEGVLIYPLHYEAGRKYPLILIVHGGPEAHVSNGWVTSYSRPGQAAAARGFAVFYPNYRGSTGRGVEFSKMGHADAAGKEFDDFVDAVDHLVGMGLVDKDKVGITGGSYGGYASAWGATYYSHRFAASVMFVGISDNVSKVGTTDIPEEMYLVHHRKRLWDDWDYFLNRSPIRHIEKNRTPTLILHGKSDPRVHPSQSLEFFRHLKTLDQAPVRLVLYPGEGHGNRRAAARLDYSLRLLRWMEHYLQGPGGSPPDYTIDYAEALEP